MIKELKNRERFLEVLNSIPNPIIETICMDEDDIIIDSKDIYTLEFHKDIKKVKYIVKNGGIYPSYITYIFISLVNTNG
jgi:hypothetical protein